MLNKHPNSSSNLLCTFGYSGNTASTFICLTKPIKPIFKILGTFEESKEKYDEVYPKNEFLE